MLRVAKVSAGAAAYYLATLPGAAAPDTRLLEPEAAWLGGASRQLGLSGEVTPESLRAVLSGRHPADGHQLLPAGSARRVAAYDCVFSCPKSVSLLFALGPPELQPVVRAAHDEAVAASLGYLEREAARWRLRRLHESRSVPSSGVVAAAFPHRASRAPDPHLHTHVVVANLVPTGDGTWRSLDARRWYAELGTAAALYETHLRFELGTAARVRFRALEGRSWSDVAGLDPAVVRAFSGRSAQISRALSEAGLDVRASRLVADATRPAKDLGVAFDDRVAQWRERGYRLGLSDAALARTAGRRPLPEPHGGHDAHLRAELDAAVVLALSRSTDRSFSRSDLVRARCATAEEGRRAADVERDVDALVSGRMSSGSVVSRGGHGVGPGRLPPGEWVERFTTSEVLAAESRLVAAVASQPDRVRLIAYPAGGRLAALDEARSLASGVRAAVLAPGRVAASSAESLTGLRAFGRSRHVPDGLGALVVADAHALGREELEGALLGAPGRRLVLLAPEAVVARDPLFGRLAGVAAEASLTGGERAGPSIDRALRVTSFGSTTVHLAGGARASLALVRELAGEGGSFVAAGDRDVRAELGRDPSLAGRVLAPGALAEAARGGTRRRPAARLVVLGGAAELRLSQPMLDCFERAHVLVEPPPGVSVPGRTGRIAELVRPAALVRELGVPRRDDEGRERWRRQAALVLEGAPFSGRQARDRSLERGAGLGR